MNTCDRNQVWTTSHCQDHPRLTLQNLTFVDASAKAETEFDASGSPSPRLNEGLFRARTGLACRARAWRR